MLIGGKKMTRPRRGAAALVALLVSAIAFAAPQQKNVVEPVPSAASERSIVGGEAVRFSLAGPAGEVSRFTVEQKGIDLVVSVLAEDGALLDRYDEAKEAKGGEEVEWIHGSAGVVVEIKAKGDQGSKGSFVVHPVVTTTADASERELIEAKKGLRTADRLAGDGSAEGIRNARSLYESVAAMFEKRGETRLAGAALDGLAWVQDESGEKRLALSTYEKALQFRRAAKDGPGEAMTLQGIGLTYIYLGEYDKALAFNQQVLDLSRAAGDRNREGGTLHNMGGIYWSIDEMQTALDYYTRALAIWRELKQRGNEASTLNNLGDVYRRLGDNDKALSYFNQALAIRRELGNRRGEAHSLHTIGLVYLVQEQFEKARHSFAQALELRKATGDKRGEAYSTGGLAGALKGLGRLDEAQKNQEQALTMWKSIGERRAEAETTYELANVVAARGDHARALTLLNEALPVSRRLKDSSSEANALLSIARVHRDRGDLDAAQRQAEEALAVVEQLRSRIGSFELRAAYFSSVKKFYDFYVDLLMRRHARDSAAGFDVKAFEASERARARSLLETLATANVDIRKGVDGALLDSEKTLLQSMARKQKQQARLIESGAAAGELTAIEEELAALISQHDQLLAKIRMQSPAYAALVMPTSLTLAEVQSLLDPDTALLEYYLGETQSFAWVVTKGGLSSHLLPARRELEDGVRALHEALISRPAAASAAAADARYWETASKIAAAIVPPVELPHRLVIAPDGALNYVSYRALPERDGKRPLIAAHEITSIPSASVLATIRQEMAGRTPASRSLAVLADPVFQRNDPRVRQDVAGSGVARAAETVTSSRSEDDMLGTLPRLRFSRSEADAISALAPETNLTALDFEARRDLVVSGSLRDFRTIHFATHGLLNSRHPELSGLVLSMVDEKGGVRDGFLRLQEIYNLDLNADLVVLSACRTALGAEVKGEGLIGLTRGFMFAGAPRVIATLWQVDDRATAELMKRFYREMLVEKKAPSEALRLAQVSMAEQPRWSSPYFWAAFQLQGEWR